jgi:hypothetical protein
LIKHHFHASSWPTNHPRFKHPIYGEVERCNWNPECVKLWDSNTAFFNSLPEQEQLKLVHMKAIEDAKHPLKTDDQGPVGHMAPVAGMPVAPAVDGTGGQVALPAAVPAGDAAAHADDGAGKASKKGSDKESKKDGTKSNAKDLRAKDVRGKAS